MQPAPARDAKGIDKRLLSRSHHGLRVLIWIISLPTSIFLSALCAFARMPEAPIWLVVVLGLVVWPFLGFMLDRLVTAQAEAFDAVFSGDLEAQRALLAKRRNSWIVALDVHGTAALELATGEVLAGRQRIVAIPKVKFGPNVWATRLSDAHVLVMDPNPAERARTLGILLALKPTRLWGKRYRAYLLAQAALHEPVASIAPDGSVIRDASAIQAHDLLCRHAAQEIRAYDDPIAVHFARMIEAARRLDTVAELPADLRITAAMARGYGADPIALELDARASAAERAKEGPYRG